MISCVCVSLSHLEFLGIKKMLKDNDSLILHPFRSISPSLPPVQQPDKERERERERELYQTLNLRENLLLLASFLLSFLFLSLEFGVIVSLLLKVGLNMDGIT